MSSRALGGLAVAMLCLGLVGWLGDAGSRGAVEMEGGMLGAIDRFRRAQARLERATGRNGPRLGIRGMIDRNEAQGDALAAQLAEGEDKADGTARQMHGDGTWQALREVDDVVRRVGLGSARHGLLGNMRSSRIEGAMALGQLPTWRTTVQLGGSLRQELRDSQKQLGDMEAGASGYRSAKGDAGLSESALQSLTDGLQQGLSVRRTNPIDGLTEGQLVMSDLKDADAISRKELRSVASARMRTGGTLVGMGR